MRSVFGDSVFIGQDVEALPAGPRIRRFDPVEVDYHSFCDDFGPMNLSSVVNFIEQLEKELSLNPQAKIIYCVSSSKRALTNASFLLGCYMI
jgi:hypothetical protein